MTGNTGGGSTWEQPPWESPHSKAEGKAWGSSWHAAGHSGLQALVPGEGGPTRRSLARRPGGTQAATPTQHLSFPLEGLVLAGESQPFQIHNSPFI